MASNMKRTTENVMINETSSAGPLPPEMAVLDRLVGDWSVTATVKDVEHPDGIKATWQTAARSILGGRVIATQSSGHPRFRETYSLTTFDSFSKAYGFWQFRADGSVLDYGGGWDEKAQTMKWHWAGKDGSQSSNTWRFVDADRHDWQVLTKDALGKTTLNVQATSVRQNDAAWVSLFNCKDLTGWKAHPDLPSDWKVEDGNLVGRAKQKKPSYLLSDKGDYQNFRYRIEAKLSKGGEVGQLFRAEFAGPFIHEPNEYLPWGYQARFGDRQSPTTGAVDRILPASEWNSHLVWQNYLVPEGEWFTEEVIADGPRITVLVNGKTVAAIDETKEMIKTKESVRHPVRDRGFLGLHASNSGDGTSEVHIRKIEIQELPPSQSDEVRLQGMWKAVMVERNGNALAEAERDKVGITFKGDKMKWTIGGNSYEGALKLDPSRYPKEIDFYRENRRSRPTKIKGIYSLVGETLVVCLVDSVSEENEPQNEARPFRFVTRPGERLVYMQLLREKQDPTGKGKE
jgi:uncharacterized protein (TIGR03067 family)